MGSAETRLHFLAPPVNTDAIAADEVHAGQAARAPGRMQVPRRGAAGDVGGYSRRASRRPSRAAVIAAAHAIRPRGSPRVARARDVRSGRSPCGPGARPDGSRVERHRV
jgi:hypothetical protein